MSAKPLTYALTAASLTFLAFAYADFHDGGSGGGSRAVVELASAQTHVAAQTAPPAPQAARPPLVPCDEAAADTPCVEAVTDIMQITGMWRRFYQGANSMAYTEYLEDGTFTITHSLGGELHGTGQITFEDGLAAIAANPDGPAAPPCKEPGYYELRLIRLGERPVALSHVLVSEDNCAPRVGDLSRPMVYYEGSGDDLALDPDMTALEQPLVPCDEDRPCDALAAQAEDIVGVWKQYLGNPMLNAPGGMGYIRYRADGTYSLADTPENTAAPHPPYPRGTYTLEDGVISIAVEGEMVPPECRSARHTLRVYRYGNQPVALVATPVEDACPGRLSDMSRPLVWVTPAD